MYNIFFEQKLEIPSIPINESRGFYHKGFGIDNILLLFLPRWESIRNVWEKSPHRRYRCLGNILLLIILVQLGCTRVRKVIYNPPFL